MITDTTARAEHTMSVCNGAFLLAGAGLLDGLTATTTSGRIDQLRAEYPKVHVVDDRRFVDNGKIITTGGLSSGIDGALHVVSVMLGRGEAQQTALAEEYDWRPSSGFARASLADRNIPEVDVDGLGKWKIERTEGGTDRWEVTFQGNSDLTAAQLMERLGRELATKGKWVKVETAGTRSSANESTWRFTGRDGRAWTATLTIQPEAGTKSRYTANLALSRLG